MSSGSDIETTVRQILQEHARIPGDISELGDDDDLFQAGMSSHASVTVMLAVEDSFDVEFPDEVLKRSTFATIRSLVSTVEGLTG